MSELQVTARLTIYSSSVAAIMHWYMRAQVVGANLLLNVGPDADGLIPEYNKRYLQRAAKELGL